MNTYSVLKTADVGKSDCAEKYHENKVEITAEECSPGVSACKYETIKTEIIGAKCTIEKAKPLVLIEPERLLTPGAGVDSQTETNQILHYNV